MKKQILYEVGDSQCDRELKKLGNKHPNLRDDLNVFCRAHLHASSPRANPQPHQSFLPAGAVYLSKNQDGSHIVKARLYSRDLKNKTSLRVIYFYRSERITIIEIYSKSDKSREDKKRWQAYRK